jgi:osmotically-inducible protein OsmY
MFRPVDFVYTFLAFSIPMKREIKSDTQLQSNVLAELQWEPAVEANGIGVEVREGVVTLDGSVSTYPEKWEAEKAAQRVAGVKAVAVDLAVSLAGSEMHEDGDTAHAAAQTLHYLTLCQESAGKVLVEDGWIELTGELEWDFQRRRIEAVLRHIPGVKGMNSYVKLGPKVSNVAVKAEIEAALKRRVVVDSHRILVAVEGTEVTLSGRVGSWAERDLARHSTWRTTGVGCETHNTVVAA